MTNTRIRIRCLLFLIAVTFVVFAAMPAGAQLAAPNSSGVTMGHIHLFVKDVEAQKKFWTTTMGGTVVQNGPLMLVRIPRRVHHAAAEPTRPDRPRDQSWITSDSRGRICPPRLPSGKADGVEIEQTGNPNQGYVHGPDGIRVEFFGDPSLPTAVAMNHIHFYPVDIPAMQAWYAKTFGGVPGQRQRQSSPGLVDCDDIPGANLSFSQGKTALAPTKGRSLDHIGFDVKNLEAFTKKLDAQGIKLDEGPRLAPNGTTKVAYITDPWGTRVELTREARARRRTDRQFRRPE